MSGLGLPHQSGQISGLKDEAQWNLPELGWMDFLSKCYKPYKVIRHLARFMIGQRSQK
jgi:hypothetical protein